MITPSDPASAYSNLDYHYPGLTKREYFAALAMQGLMAADADKVNRWSPRMIAQVAVDNADALIDELNVEDRHG